MSEYRDLQTADPVEEEEQTASIRRSDRFYRPSDTAEALKKLFWKEFELSRIVFGWLPAVKEFETKAKMGRYGYLHAQHAEWLFERIGELPGSFPERLDAPPLYREMFERIGLAPSEGAFLNGYGQVLERLQQEYDRLSRRLDPVLDAPSLDKLRYIGLNLREMIPWLFDQIRFTGADDGDEASRIAAWQRYAEAVWRAGADDAAEHKSWPAVPPDVPAGPVPRDSAWNEERFPIHTWNSAYRQAYSDPAMSPLNDSIKQMHYINATEMGAAEPLCYLYFGALGMPKSFYFDLARHLWDEVRHSQMGVRRLEQMGYATNQFRYFKGSPGRDLADLAKEWFPDMYANLTMVAEPCSFIKKRKSTEHFWAFGDALSAIHCEFDMADERMHVNFGKKWGPELYKQIDRIVTAVEMAERTRLRRVEELGAAVTEEEAKKVVRNFPGFCGLSTVELNYTNY